MILSKEEAQELAENIKQMIQHYKEKITWEKTKKKPPNYPVK